MGLYVYVLTSFVVTKTSSRKGAYVQDDHYHVIIIIIVIILSSFRVSGLLRSPAIYLQVFLLTVFL